MRRLLILAAAGGSAALLLGALGFQYIGEMPPCKLCYWQRYPHVAAAGIGILALLIPGAILPYLGAVAALTTAGIGIYHSGVERLWWEGPTTCTSGSISDLTPEQLMEQIMGAPLVRCDEIPWEMFTLSMASWNAIASLVLVGFWIAAAKRS
ncbi:disulfide bond formation protein B [Sedimentitalea sp. CY04]|uniref:Disulfide bond formation protein B n=1 Tax=Parasedimentitalea denitrificans TaxID=2211118 RepID=A0ABX0WB98_9RHOB|nr:disulfide bond formation protein B [Sedimentitalea sp. CY04]NIZ61575.1 disulfide bond formation protein B [Sedimentitalea sp. CY04]